MEKSKGGAGVSESSRAFQVEIPAFSKIALGQSFSFGGTPFHILGRKWGINLYPFGLRQNSHDYSQRIDVYVHIWAKDPAETEQDFLNWVHSNNINFTVTVSEPQLSPCHDPLALHYKKSSAESWCDMEDAAGWWLITLKANNKLLNLNNDTLLISVEFSTTSSSSKIPKQFTPAPINPHTTGLSALLNNPTISDFSFLIQDSQIYAQRCILESKLPGFTTILASLSTNELERSGSVTSTISSGTLTNTSQKSITSPLRVHLESETCLRIDKVPYTVFYAFLEYIYANTPPTPPTNSESTTKTNPTGVEPLEFYIYTHILSELFTLPSLSTYTSRKIYASLTPQQSHLALSKHGAKSTKIQEILTIYVIQNFDNIKRIGFDSLLGDENVVPKAAQIVSIFRRIAVKYSNTADDKNVEEQRDGEEKSGNGPKGGNGFAGGTEKMKLDWRHSLAFRSLLSNPTTSDVKFVIENKPIYAQKSVLMAVSDYFLTMFTSGLIESTETTAPTIIQIPDFPYTTVHAMLLFLYTSELDVPANITEIGYIYVISDKYQLPELESAAWELLKRYMTPENVASFLFGFAFKYEKLRSVVVEFLCREFERVKVSGDFLGCVRGWRMFEDWRGVVREVLERVEVRGFVLVEGCDEEMGFDDEGFESCEDDEDVGGDERLDDGYEFCELEKKEKDGGDGTDCVKKLESEEKKRQ